MSGLDTLMMGLTCHGNVNVPYTKRKNLISYLILCGIGSSMFLLLSLLCYCIWKFGLQLLPPVPFNGWIITTFGCILMFVAVWYR